MISPVKLIREKLLLTQGDLALRLGISRQMVWAYESGKSMPRFDVVKKLMAMAKHNDVKVNAEDFFV
jgi:transcriptional regulator with XRE-family HTH domain